jgi:hypothetical protein
VGDSNHDRPHIRSLHQSNIQLTTQSESASDTADETREQRSDRPVTQLTATQCGAANSSQHPTTATNDALLKKRDRVAERLQYLLDDIVALEGGEYLTDTNWSDGRVARDGSQQLNHSKLLSDIDSDALFDSENVIHTDAYEPDHKRYETTYAGPDAWLKDVVDINLPAEIPHDGASFSNIKNKSDELRFGYAIGTILRSLTPESEDNEAAIDVLWGLMLGFLGDDSSGHSDEIPAFDTILSELSTRNQRRKERLPSNSDIEAILTRMKGKDEKSQAISDGIRDAGIWPTLTVVHEVKSHGFHTDKPEWIRTDATNTTEALIEETPLEEIQTLAEYVVRDIDTICDNGRLGVDALIEPLLGLWEPPSDAADETSSADTADRDDGEQLDGLDEPQDPHQTAPENSTQDIADFAQSQITACLNQLTSDGDDLRTEAPLVSKQPNTGRGDTWQLTAYGKVICAAADWNDSDDAPNANINWLYDYAIAPHRLQLYQRAAITNALVRLSIADTR